MASPTVNSVPSTSYSPLAFGGISSLLDGQKWGGAVGTGVTLTFSMPGNLLGDTSWWDPTYSTLDEPSAATFFYFTTPQRTAAVAALAAWSLVSNVGFVASTDNQTTVGEIRFAFSSDVSNTSYAHAYSPGNDPVNGDIWFHPSADGDSTAKGGYFYLATMHEIGHALGLNHSFAMGARDSYFYSIMSYTASPWSSDGDNYASFYPTTPMYDDLRAIHAIYGRDMTTNVGNTVYTFSGGRYFQTIYDAGGNDQIAYTGGLG